MAFLEFGEAGGLAYEKNWDAQQQRELELTHLKRQYRIDAENKAKLFGDIQYGSAMNKWDSQQINGFTAQQTTALGKYVNENPNFDKSVPGMMEYNRLKQGFLNNPSVQRGMRVDAHIKALNEFAVKHPEFSEELKPQYAQVRNYEQTGSIDGMSQNAHEYVFNSPEEAFDDQKYIKDNAHDIKMDGFVPYGQNTDGFRQFVTDAAQKDFAESILSGSRGKYFQAKFEKSPDKDKYKNATDWLMHRAQPYFGDKIEIGKTPRVGKSGSGGEGTSPVAVYNNLLALAQKNPGKPIDTPPGGAEKILTDPRTGNYVLDNVEAVNPLTGNRLPLNIGIVHPANASTADSKIYYFPDANHPGQGKHYVSVKVSLPIDQFEANVASDHDAVDMPTWGTQWMGNRPSLNAPYDKAGSFKITKDDKGNGMVEFSVLKPISNNEGFGMAFNDGAGAAAQKGEASPQSEYQYEDDQFYYRQVAGGWEKIPK